MVTQSITCQKICHCSKTCLQKIVTVPKLVCKKMLTSPKHVCKKLSLVLNRTGDNILQTGFGSVTNFHRRVMDWVTIFYRHIMDSGDIFLQTTIMRNLIKKPILKLKEVKYKTLNIIIITFWCLATIYVKIVFAHRIPLNMIELALSNVCACVFYQLFIPI